MAAEVASFSIFFGFEFGYLAVWQLWVSILDAAGVETIGKIYGLMGRRQNSLLPSITLKGQSSD